MARPETPSPRAMLPAVPGTLYVIATPLGNLDDLSPRAVERLRRVSCIACEDTRRTARLRARFDIDTPMLACHKFNEGRQSASLLRRLEGGEDVALVADGGTPAIADPGALFVRAALERGIIVVPLPGPSALAALLSACGMPADRFVFEGFLPNRAAARRRRLRELREETRTLVFYEAPHRILDTLEDLDRVFGEREMVLGRELTKLHESILRGTAAEVREALGPQPRGEITLVVSGAREGAADVVEPKTQQLRQAWRRALEQGGGDRRRALRACARELGWERDALRRALDEIGED